MEALKIDPEYLYRMAKYYPDIIKHIEEEAPNIYQDGEAYCCLSGSDPVEGIFGCGPTPQDALEDWEKGYQKKGAA